jgi:transcriptional regulator with XRE-family HTH domain
MARKIWVLAVEIDVERIKALKKARGYTNKEIATRSGLSIRTINALTRGRKGTKWIIKRPNPTLSTINALAQSFDVPPSFLIKEKRAVGIDLEP